MKIQQKLYEAKKLYVVNIAQVDEAGSRKSLLKNHNEALKPVYGLMQQHLFNLKLEFSIFIHLFAQLHFHIQSFISDLARRSVSYYIEVYYLDDEKST